MPRYWVVYSTAQVELAAGVAPEAVAQAQVELHFEALHLRTCYCSLERRAEPFRHIPHAFVLVESAAASLSPARPLPLRFAQATVPEGPVHLALPAMRAAELVQVAPADLRHQLAVFAEYFDLPFSLLLST